MFAVTALTLLLASPLSLPLDAWRADPAVEMEDAYKWIYQATHGGEHAVPDREAAALWLQREWESLEAPSPREPLIEPLGSSGVVRLNLRPYRSVGGQRDALLDAFLLSASSFAPDKAAFECAWHALGERLRRDVLGRLTRSAWERLDAENRQRGYPPLHHSATYARVRRPAYRVLTADRATRLIANLGAGPSKRQAGAGG